MKNLLFKFKGNRLDSSRFDEFHNGALLHSTTWIQINYPQFQAKYNYVIKIEKSIWLQTFVYVPVQQIKFDSIDTLFPFLEPIGWKQRWRPLHMEKAVELGYHGPSKRKFFKAWNIHYAYEETKKKNALCINERDPGRKADNK